MTHHEGAPGETVILLLILCIVLIAYSAYRLMGGLGIGGVLQLRRRRKAHEALKARMAEAKRPAGTTS